MSLDKRVPDRFKGKASDLERLDTLAGYEQGVKNGKRLAKGKSEWPKSLKRPSMTKCYETAYEQGIRNGKRLEKGKSEFPQSVGHPKLLDHEILILQFIDFVDARMNEERISLPAAVSRYRDVFARAWKKLNSPRLESDEIQEQLLRLYKRAQKPNVISDNGRRVYQLLRSGSLDSPDT